MRKGVAQVVMGKRIAELVARERGSRVRDRGKG